jgi:hypothetical protein
MKRGNRERERHTLIPIETLTSLDTSNQPEPFLLLAHIDNSMFLPRKRLAHQTLPATHTRSALRATRRRRRRRSRTVATRTPILKAVRRRRKVVVEAMRRLGRRSRKRRGRRLGLMVRELVMVVRRSRTLALALRYRDGGRRRRRRHDEIGSGERVKMYR